MAKKLSFKNKDSKHVNEYKNFTSTEKFVPSQDVLWTGFSVPLLLARWNVYEVVKLFEVESSGHQEELKVFEKEDDACLYIYNKFKRIIDM